MNILQSVKLSVVEKCSESLSLGQYIGLGILVIILLFIFIIGGILLDAYIDDNHDGNPEKVVRAFFTIPMYFLLVLAYPLILLWRSMQCCIKSRNENKISKKKSEEDVG